MSRATKYKKPPQDVLALHRALSDLVKVYQFRDRSKICCHDVSVTQCYALEALINLGPLTLTGLAEELYLEKSTASRVVNALERKGYVRRSDDPSDSRAVILTVTSGGRVLYDRIERELVEATARLADDFEPEVRRAAARLLARFARTAVERFTGKKSCLRG